MMSLRFRTQKMSMATLVADASATNLCHKYKLILKEVVCEGHLRNKFCPQNSNELILGISAKYHNTSKTSKCLPIKL